MNIPVDPQDYVAQRIALEERARARRFREWVLIAAMSMLFGAFSALSVAAVINNSVQRESRAGDRVACDSRIVGRSQINADHAVVRAHLADQAQGTAIVAAAFRRLAKKDPDSAELYRTVSEGFDRSAQHAITGMGAIADLPLPVCDIPDTKSSVPPGFKRTPPAPGAPVTPAGG